MALTKIPSSLLDTSSGFDLQGNITLGDNEQIQLGASGDLAIYHDGSHSFITDSGTGNLRLQGTNLTLQNAAGTKNYFLGSDGGAVTLYHNNDAKIATSSTGATVTGNLAVTGDLDITGNVNSYNVTDLDVTDQTITLGAGQTEANSGGSGIIIDGSSASILWDETNSVFDFNKDISLDNGLFFSSQDFYLYRSAADVATLRVGDSGSYKYFQFTDTGTVARFNSASGAVSLGSGANDHLLINSSGNVGIGTDGPASKLHIEDAITGDASQLRITNGAGATLRMGITGSGANEAAHIKTNAGEDLEFHIGQAADSVTPRVIFDSSGNVGIAGTPPSDANTGYPLLSIGETTVIQGLNDSNESFFTNNAIWKSDNSWEYVKNVRAVQMAFADGTTIFRQAASGTAGNDITWSESMRIDNSGNLLVGQTIASSGTVGISLRADGRTFFCADGTYAAHFNRNTSDGAIAHFVKDDSIVGSIGASVGDLTIYGTASGHSGFRFTSGGIAPVDNTGSLVADSVDIGQSSWKFRDLYLSGGAYLGGTGSANYLDDYEEGTYDATISCASGSITLYSSYTALRYTKIGRQVHIHGKLAVNSVSSPTGATNLNLPFVISNDTDRAGQADNIMSGYFNGSAVTNGIYPIYGYMAEATSVCRLFIMVIPATHNLGDNYTAQGTDYHINFTYTTD